MSGVRRSRWAAIGAAVAVSLGAGGLGLARASTGVESSFVSVTPARVLDNRGAGLGLTGPLVSPTPRVLQVTGPIARPDGSTAVVVPPGATAVVLNVTVVGPTAAGFLSVRPDGTPGAPETSNLNFNVGDIIPNAVTVALPASGAIELTYNAFDAVGPTTDALVDVTGYYVATTGGGGATGPAGPQGATGATGLKGHTGATGPMGPTGSEGPIGPAGADGPTGSEGPIGPAGADGAVGPVGPIGPAGADGAVGPVGPIGPAGADGAVGPVGPIGPAGVDGPMGPAGADGATGETGATGPGYDLAQVVWVAKSGGDFTLLSAALASITDNSASKPYVVKIAPGVYTEPGPVAMKNFVDVEGSGQGVTTLTCVCGSQDFPGGFVTAGNISAQIRHLTINNTGGSTNSAAVTTNGVANTGFSLLHVTANATGGKSNYGVFNESSSPSMINVTATATGVEESFGVYNQSSSPLMNNVTVTATTSNGLSYGVRNNSSSPLMNNVTVTATGGLNNYGVWNESSSSPAIRGSSVTGSFRSVINFSSTVKIADTTLNGSVEAYAGGVFTCVGVHNQNFIALNASCTGP